MTTIVRAHQRPHVVPRPAFAAAATLGTLTLTGAIGFALTPKPVPRVPTRDVAVTSAARLSELPRRFVVPELRGLDARARAARGCCGGRADRDGDLAVYLLMLDGAARGYIALDPRTNCRLEFLADHGSVFYDVCHGSTYDLHGRRAGGPSPFSLDQIVVSVRDGTVYASRRDVLPGRWPH